MTLSESLQEIQDAKAKGLITDAEATAQREAVLARHRDPKPSTPLVWSHVARRGRRCCSPVLRSKLVHGWVVVCAALGLLASIAIVSHFQAEVWIDCQGADAHLLNASHPYFCDDHHDDYDDDDDHDHHWRQCGNERFEFGWNNIKYSKKNFEREMSWSEVLGMESQRVFTDSIGTFTGNSTIFTQSHWGKEHLRKVGIAHLVFSAIGVLCTVKIICLAFCVKPRIERQCMWVKISFIFMVAFGLSVATVTLTSNMDIVRRTHHHRHHERDDSGEYNSAPAWNMYYQDSYGCLARPLVPTIAFGILGITSAVLLLGAVWLRSCCMRCKSRDLDEAELRWQVQSTSTVNPMPIAVNAVPPPYGATTGMMSAADEKAALANASVV